MRENVFDRGTIDRLKEERERWRNECYSKQREFKQSFRTLSGFPVEPLYTPEHLADFDYFRDLGFPGEYP